MIEIPPRFAGMPPVNPEARKSLAKGAEWKGAAGLAEDVRYYGEWMKQEAFKRIGHLYPKVKVPPEQGGGEATVIAWLWARSIKCPNPVCNCEIPLIHSYFLSKKKGKETWVEPIYPNNQLSFKIHYNGTPKIDGTVNRKGAICPHCGSAVEYSYIRDESRNHGFSYNMTSIVAEGKNGRLYISPTSEQINATYIEKPKDYPLGELSYYPGHLNTYIYGLDEFHMLFTNRQLTAMTTLCDMLNSVQSKILDDGKEIKGFINSYSKLLEYAQAIRVYLSFLIDKLADLGNALNRWEPNAQCPRQLFARQAIPMVWDFAEGNPFSSSSGSWDVLIRNFLGCFNADSFNFERDKPGIAQQFDAQSDCGLRDIMISTDPPYYDNIGYADLSDFFYVWLRYNLMNVYPDLFKTLLVPKKEELVAMPHRFDGSVQKAKTYFEDGMVITCKKFYKYVRDDIPVTIYYAYKQSETEDDITASSGWETMLSAIIQSGFVITGTWPMKTECGSRSISQGRNALASSVVLVCRKRPENALSTTRRNFIAELKRELRPALKKLQDSNIAPVDLAQSAIGPGMGVFSKYKQVLDADGKPMSVRAALQIINQELDIYFNEQDGVLDADSRFCVELYTQFAFNELKYGDANTLAMAKNTSVEKIAAAGVLSAKKGTVRLLERDELPEDVKPNDTFIWRLTQQLTHAMESGGIKAVGRLTAEMLGGNAEAARDLAYRLFTIADRKHWNAEAYAYNNLVSAWPDIQSRAAEVRRAIPKQETLF